MAYFPIFTDISQKKCVIIGGGSVALRKIETLLRYDARILVVAREICPAIQKLLPEKALCCREVSSADLLDAVLVIAATDSRSLNHQVYLWCKEIGVPVNVIDAPEECTFLFPSVVKRGDISIGISTAGKSPLLSKEIRKGIEKTIPAYFEEAARQLGILRRYVKENLPQESRRRALLKKAAARIFALERTLTEEEMTDLVRTDDWKKYL